MRLILDGRVDDNGMVIDYFDVKRLVDPLVDRLDHSFLCDADDVVMRSFFDANPMKHVVVPFTTTAENLAQWFLEQITELLLPYPNVISISVRVHETERTYAEVSTTLATRHDSA